MLLIIIKNIQMKHNKSNNRNKSEKKKQKNREIKIERERQRERENETLGREEADEGGAWPAECTDRPSCSSSSPRFSIPISSLSNSYSTEVFSPFLFLKALSSGRIEPGAMTASTWQWAGLARWVI